MNWPGERSGGAGEVLTKNQEGKKRLLHMHPEVEDISSLGGKAPHEVERKE